MSAKSSSRTANQSTLRTPKQQKDYTDQEEEYKYAMLSSSRLKHCSFVSRRLNAQLEAKTQALVEEAEQVLVRESVN